ncbi:helix-turn-helix domain-containing protein [Pontibacter indicus]|uniref:helix-turn-helix domain-containing protein n=1 Tax=Pontibacter indicus TaxID=1317125 RepID=UPI00097749AD|nr:helix-turn-helix domain-containing protein [Pontibacter indicus]
MSVQQQLNTATLQLVQLSLEELSTIISNQVSAELQKLLPQLRSTIEGAINQDKIYSRQEAADKLCVSPTTLHNWKKRGLLVPMQAGRKCLYTAVQLEAFLNQREIGKRPY